MSGVGVAVVGLLLCFAGAASVHLAVLASGFALGWLLADSLGGDVGVAVVVALCGAALAWVLGALVFKAALFVVGGIAGGVVGAKLFGLLDGGDSDVVLAVVFVVAVALLTGLAAQHLSGGVLGLACALGGAGLVLSGLARAWPDAFDFLRTPDTSTQTLLAGAAWLVLGALGWSVQRRWTHRQPTHAR